VSPLFFLLKKLTTFFAHHLITVPYIHFTRVSPPGGCHPAPFLPLRPRLSTIFCKFSHKYFSFRCHPLEGVTRGDPPSDATGNGNRNENGLMGMKSSHFPISRPRVADRSIIRHCGLLFLYLLYESYTKYKKQEKKDKETDRQTDRQTTECNQHVDK